MSINNSYFSKNNTIISNSYINTGRNPVMELLYGTYGSQTPIGFTRFIFDLDLSLLEEKINDGTISTNCGTGNTITHTLRMTNTCAFDKDFLNTTNSQGRQRATSFDLVLFRIPYINNDPLMLQTWDEGVGYDYIAKYDEVVGDKNFSLRPSNWFQTTTISGWTNPGLYSNINQGIVNYSGLTIVDTQHFEFGDENISFNMTNEINDLLNGVISSSGWGIAFLPQIENLTGLTENYSVGFFTRHTQTFYEPYLETNYNDIIEDNRNLFTLNKINKLYLYTYDNGNPLNLDFPPTVSIYDSIGNPIINLTGLTSCQRTKGVYEITIPPLTGYKTPCTFSDKWSDIYVNGFKINDITNNFVIYPYKNSIQIGTTSIEPILYGFDYYGIKQDEKIFNTDIRKVGVIIKKAYSTNYQLQNIEAYYRIYVKEGITEVQVQDWTKINKTTNEYYFIFDTRDKIPNEYFIDLKIESSGEINTYKKQIKFQIVNYK